MLIRSFMIWHKEILSQSPQTGQVYFNMVTEKVIEKLTRISHNPLKRVKFISMRENRLSAISSHWCVTIPSNGSSLFQYPDMKENGKPVLLSQSPQTGQVYFNGCNEPGRTDWKVCRHNPLKRVKFISISAKDWRTGKLSLVTIPSNGSSLFQ